MTRASDADLCRLNGWKPGDILTLERYPNPRNLPVDQRLLTAVGQRAILWRWMDENGNAPIGPEVKSVGALHNYVIRKAAKAKEDK